MNKSAAGRQKRLWSTHKLPGQDVYEQSAICTKDLYVKTTNTLAGERWKRGTACRLQQHAPISSRQTWNIWKHQQQVDMNKHENQQQAHRIKSNTHSSQTEEIWKGNTCHTWKSKADRQDSAEKNQQQDRRHLKTKQTTGRFEQHDRLTGCQN